MNPDKPIKAPPEAESLQEALASATRSGPSRREPSSWEADVAQTLKLGEQLMDFAGGVMDLARAEALLAVSSLPKLLMLWLIMMPIILLTWCSFSVLIAWGAVALSGESGVGVLTFFLLQVLLLLTCRLLFVKYRRRMTFPHTRAQIDSFIQGAKNELKCRSETKE